MTMSDEGGPARPLFVRGGDGRTGLEGENGMARRRTRFGSGVGRWAPLLAAALNPWRATKTQTCNIRYTPFPPRRGNNQHGEDQTISARRAPLNRLAGVCFAENLLPYLPVRGTKSRPPPTVERNSSSSSSSSIEPPNDQQVQPNLTHRRQP